jgi:hypothetical protein
MTIHRRRRALVALALALTAWPAVEARAQSPVPAATAAVSTAEIVRAVRANPAGAPRTTAQAVAAGQPENAGTIVGAVVGALEPSDRRALAPNVVTAAIAALPAAQRTAMAASCACSAIRAVPAAERPGVVPPIISAAVAMAPEARAQIVTCAIEAAPALVEAISEAAGSTGAVQLEAGVPPSTPLPGGSIGIDSTLAPKQNCASPPCPG